MTKLFTLKLTSDQLGELIAALGTSAHENQRAAAELERYEQPDTELIADLRETAKRREALSKAIQRQAFKGG